jgi:hypothetical protein
MTTLMELPPVAECSVDGCSYTTTTSATPPR